jgi:hypothetical protein
MKHLFIFAVSVTLATFMSTMAWSQSGGGGLGGASSINSARVQTRANPVGQQYMAYTFNDPRIRRQLSLSQDQIRQLRALNNGWRQQLQRFRRGSGKNLNSGNEAQWNQIAQQYASMVNNVLTVPQQQTWSQVISRQYARSVNAVGQARGPNNISTGTQQANAGGGSSAVGTAVVTGEPRATNRAGATQADGGGGSSAAGTAAVNGEPTATNRAGATQAEGGGGSSAVGTAVVTGQPVGTNSPGATQAQQGGGSSLAGTLLL